MRPTPLASDAVIVTLVPWTALTRRNYEKFNEFFTTAIGPEARLVVDLQRVQTLDGWGVRALVDISRLAAQAGGQVKYCGMTRRVRALLETVRLHRVCDLYNDRDEALLAFQL
ncbi:MAG: STAS domain-containing protein [Blastocatellia bacterium]|nr:STAS domain-containing protein [Blastocatellia bacterium]